MKNIISENLIVFLSFIVSFIIAYAAIPTIIKVARYKNLYDEPDLRKAHLMNIPTLGGLAIFAGFILSYTVLGNCCALKSFQYILAATTILFFIGVKDDILVTAPFTKLAGQLFAACILVFLGDIRITNLHGFFNINEIYYIPSVLLSLLVIVYIINGFNLIDGIDGLASGIGIVTAATFGIWFYLSGHMQYAILAACLVGSLLAFFRFNVFSKKNKIFMGDTGSLILGLILAILAIEFNELNINSEAPYSVHSAPAITLSILILPIFDTLRVIIIRLFNNYGLFKPDKNHIHHALIEIGLSHFQATLVLIIINILFILVARLLSELITLRSLILLIFATALLLSYIPNELLFRKKKKHNLHDHLKQA